MPLQRRKAAPQSPEQRRVEDEAREIFDGSRTVPELIADGELVPDEASMIPAMKAIASLIRRRKLLGVTASGVADRMGVDKSTISRLESGANHNPSVETLSRCAASLDAELEIRCVPTKAGAAI